MKKKIVITGGSGRFGSILKKNYFYKNLFFPSKKELNILSEKSIGKYLDKIKPKILIHLAGLSRPMQLHEKNIIESINLNIIGTANIVKVCKKKNVKLIYFSTNYVYPGNTGNYKETDSLLPINNYAWSKLGGECSVQMYKNSLILRVCMTEKPFIHKEAYSNVKTNFIFQEEVAYLLFKILDRKGIINIGGKTQTVYNFAKKYNFKIKKKKLIKSTLIKNNISMSIQKLKSII
jgi:dTDP-4-dehydrorhamnose reductase